MSTVSLSLPTQQINLIDRLAQTYGFSNRSEFIRALLRFLLREPTIVKQATTYPFVSPKEKSVKKILADFKRTKKYSPAFLKDLKDGLELSNYFK